MDGPIDIACRLAAAEDGFAEPRQNIDAVPGLSTPARTQLALASADLARAAAELAAAQEPAARLAAVIAEAARVEAELTTLQAADEARLGIWLAGGGAGHRPEPDPATVAAERRREALAADAIAARAALPAAERSFQHRAERVRELQRQRDLALCGAAIDVVRDFAQRYRAALTAALEHEAVLHGVRDELLVRANRPEDQAAALAAAARIGELIVETKRGVAVRHHPEAGRQLLAALASDPDATL
jgi:hypothetical protein